MTTPWKIYHGGVAGCARRVSTRNLPSHPPTRSFSARACVRVYSSCPERSNQSRTAVSVTPLRTTVRWIVDTAPGEHGRKIKLSRWLQRSCNCNAATGRVHALELLIRTVELLKLSFQHSFMYFAGACVCVCMRVCAFHYASWSVARSWRRHCKWSSTPARTRLPASGASPCTPSTCCATLSPGSRPSSCGEAAFCDKEWQPRTASLPRHPINQRPAPHQSHRRDVAPRPSPAQ